MKLNLVDVLFLFELCKLDSLEQIVEGPGFVLRSNCNVFIERLEADVCNSCSVILEGVSCLVLILGH